MKIKQLLSIGQKLYHWRPQKIINYRWMPVFLLRCFVHRKEVNALINHFEKTDIGREYFGIHAPVWFQLTRENFYRDSTVKERLSFIITTWNFIEKHFSESARHKIYCESEESAIILWEQPYEDRSLRLELNYIDGEIKEGCATISLKLDKLPVYHMNFWIQKADYEHDDIVAYIGCHQGSKDGLDINRDLTKALFGCRPKNFVFIALQELLACLGITELYSVSDYGHYSNKFVRDTRKPKVSYDEFWTECGGTLCQDKRFFALPLHDKRKTYEEIPSKKRSTYRKRYELLDQVIESIKKSCNKSII